MALTSFMILIVMVVNNLSGIRPFYPEHPAVARDYVISDFQNLFPAFNQLLFVLHVGVLVIYQAFPVGLLLFIITPPEQISGDNDNPLF